MRVSLRYRLLVAPLLMLVGTAAATSYAALHAAEAVAIRDDERRGAITRTLLGPPTFPLTAPVLAQLKNLSGSDFFFVNARGDVVGTFEGTVEPPQDLRMYRKDDSHPPVMIRDVEYRWFDVKLPDNHPNADGWVFVFQREAERRQQLRDAVRPVLLLGLGGGLLAALVAWLVGRRLVARIREVEAGTRAVAAGRFEPLPLPKADDELRDLAGSVNEMATRLSANEATLHQTERLRVLGQISGGLAHQLRNAAAGARLAVQLASRAEGKDHESLAVAARQLDRLEATLKQFLSPTGTLAVALAPRCVVEVIDRLLPLFGPKCRHSNTTLEWATRDAAVVQPIDAEQWSHMASNLIDNALDAAGPGGSVRVSVDAQGFTVTDSGPGPSTEIANRIFEAFSSDKPGGLGLGLMVARLVANTHGQKIGVTRENGRTCFRVRWNENPGKT